MPFHKPRLRGKSLLLNYDKKNNIYKCQLVITMMIINNNNYIIGTLYHLTCPKDAHNNNNNRYIIMIWKRNIFHLLLP